MIRPAAWRRLPVRRTLGLALLLGCEGSAISGAPRECGRGGASCTAPAACVEEAGLCSRSEPGVERILLEVRPTGTGVARLHAEVLDPRAWGRVHRLTIPDPVRIAGRLVQGSTSTTHVGGAVSARLELDGAPVQPRIDVRAVDAQSSPALGFAFDVPPSSALRVQATADRADVPPLRASLDVPEAGTLALTLRLPSTDELIALPLRLQTQPRSAELRRPNVQVRDRDGAPRSGIVRTDALGCATLHVQGSPGETLDLRISESDEARGASWSQAIALPADGAGIPACAERPGQTVALDAPARLSAKVLRAQGDGFIPVAGARVRAVLVASPLAGLSQALDAATDEQGDAVLEVQPGTWIVAALPPPEAPFLTRLQTFSVLAAEERTLTFLCQPAPEVHGTVRDALDAPIEGARVSLDARIGLSLPAGPLRFGRAAATLTDPQGDYALGIETTRPAGATAEPVFVQARVDAGPARPYPPLLVDLAVGTAGTRLDVRMDPGWVRVLELRDPRGEPVRDALVRLSWADARGPGGALWVEARSDERGRAIVVLPAAISE